MQNILQWRRLLDFEIWTRNGQTNWNRATERLCKRFKHFLLTIGPHGAFSWDKLYHKALVLQISYNLLTGYMLLEEQNIRISRASTQTSSKWELKIIKMKMKTNRVLKLMEKLSAKHLMFLQYAAKIDDLRSSFLSHDVPFL